MILNLGSAMFHAETISGGGTPAWGTEMGQGEGYRFNFEDYQSFITALVYKSVPNPENRVSCPLGKGGNQVQDYEFVVASLFDKIFVNGLYVKGARFILLVVKKLVGNNHIGRRTLKYNPRITLDGDNFNSHCFDLMASKIGVSPNGSWFISEINVRNQDELHFTAHILDGNHPYSFVDSTDRSTTLASKIRAYAESHRQNALKRFADRVGDGTKQKIFYGCPGSGKSYKVKKDTEGVNTNFVFRTTFHPDTDYASFVGCYKPSMKDGNIEYSYSPQVFTNAYVQAWNNPDEKVYLIIEEINRGNCAQIFGDLFQLLDRDKNTGVSEYPVKADKDLADHLKEVLGADHEGIKDGELRLPSNLIIYATMNTSDQSLFPMDSAFKRRWDWEYVPIEYGADKESYTYIITIGDKKYRWVDFLKIVNEKIYDTTRSEDKQMGNFFIKKSVDAQEFINKVMFYLWNEVCKEEVGTSRNFFRIAVEGNNEGKEFKFVDLFDKANTNDLLIGFMNHLKVGEYTE